MTGHIGRIGDYVLDHEQSGRPDERTFTATHIVLPRRARIVVPEHDTPIHGARLVREACILEALRGHPGVPAVFECGRLSDRRPWLATELVDGIDVATRIVPVAMPVLEVAALLRDVSEILVHAHERGIVHCAISTTTIVFGHGGRPFLVDWSHARLPDSVTPADTAVDIHGLGYTAYEALTRALPTMSAGRRNPAAPAALTSLIDRMLSRDPAKRPTAAEVRVEAIGIANLFYIPDLEPSDETTIETVDVELVELLDLVDVEPAPPPVLKWTPMFGVQALPPGGAPIAQIALRRQRRRT